MPAVTFASVLTVACGEHAIDCHHFGHVSLVLMLEQHMRCCTRITQAAQY